MKKVFLFLILSNLFLACSSNDEVIGDQISDTADTIVGTWKLVKANGFDITDACQTKDTYVFKEDNTYTFDDYNTTNGSCVKDEDTSFKGTWKNNNDGTYNFKRHGFTGDGTAFSTVFTDDKETLTFPTNGLTYQRQ